MVDFNNARILTEERIFLEKKDTMQKWKQNAYVIKEVLRNGCYTSRVISRTQA